MNKKDYPLVILQQLFELKRKYPSESKIVKADNSLLRFEDKDALSNFYFQINSFGKNNQGFYYSVSYKPASANELEKADRNLSHPDLLKRIDNWSETIQKFNKTDYFASDPLIDSYAKEYFDEYRIIEEDADIKPFDLRRQIIIDSYLNESIKYLESYEKEIPDIDLSEPIEIATELKNTQFELTKNQVIKRLSIFWAVTRKKGLPILKQVFFELAKELMKEFGKKMIGL